MAVPDPSVSQIVAQLKDSPVYVQAGTAGTSGSTSAEIGQLLAANDHVVVVMLAGSSDPAVTAAQIGKAIGPRSIVVVSENGKAAAYAPSLSGGAAGDLLTRAENVSTNQVDTLKTFVGNVHDYQAAHPETVTSTGQPDSPLVPIVIGGSSLLGILLIATISVYVYSRRIHSKVKNNGPRDIRPAVSRLMAGRAHIRNDRMRDAIENTCIYVEAYFKRLKLDGYAKETAISQLQSQLASAVKIADTYAQIEQEPNYYTDPSADKRSGVEAVEGLAESILMSIRQKNAELMFDYDVDTKILDAQRYKYRGRR